MDRVAVFVDAGYLFAQGSKAVCARDQPLPRRRIELHRKTAIDKFKNIACQCSGLPLLRIYWYDGTSSGPTSDHTKLAREHDVKVRLGFVNAGGDQKGVDSLIVTDMLTLARNRAMAECILLSGDEDVRIGVQQAQEYGVRVHLVGIAHARPSQSEFLKQEADSTHEWTKSDLEAFLVCNCEPAFDHEPMNTEISAEDAEILREIAQHHASQLSDKKKSEVLQLTAGEDWPRNIHRALLGHAKNKFGKFLERGEQTFLKTEFRKQLENSTE